MKKNFRLIASILLSAAVCGVAACSSGDKDADKNKSEQTTKKKSKNVGPSTLPNYRYVDIDSVLANYVLAKDLSDERTRIENSMESTLRQKQNSLQNMAAGFQKKMQNNQYTSEDEYRRDQQSFANAQASAEKEAAGLQEKYAKQVVDMQKVINDSIENFIKIYNKSHGYDAIFMKAATIYINEDLDITDEVIEGLNKRYNKVK